MKNSPRHLRLALTGVLLAASATAAIASDWINPSPSVMGFTPKVPVSALARPAAWFDPSRLHVATSLSFGSGFSGGASQGLQVTSFSYSFAKPMWMSVKVGNSFGSSAHGNSSMFLEGLDLGVQPFPNFMIQVHYQDIRSPLQYDNYDSFGRIRGW